MKSLISKLFMLLLIAVLFTQLNAFAQNTNMPEVSKLNALKTAPISILIGNFGVTYERGQLIKKNISLEISAGYTNPLISSIFVTYAILNGESANMHIHGCYLNAGPKIYFGSQKYYKRGMLLSHPMYGWYFKSELGVRYFNCSDDNGSATSVKVVPSIGKQWIENNFVYELSTGIGYSYNLGEDDSNIDLQLPLGDDGSFLAFQLRLRLGFLFSNN